MNWSRRLLAAALLAGFSPAIAQQFPTINDHTVIGRIGSGTGAGPSQAIPWTQLLPVFLPQGTSVFLNPSTSKLEGFVQVQTNTANGSACTASCNFAATDLFKRTRRSNSGSAMTDSLPASGVALTNGTRIQIVNADATASDTITAGAGTTILGGSSFILGPGRDLMLTYDLANTTWRSEGNTATAVLGPAGLLTANLPLIGNSTGGATQGTLTGNTTKFATSTGTLTTNDCIKADASGNLVDNGATCGAGNNIADNQQFVAGTGFTAGTTTSLTLHSTPTNASELLIFFDGVNQSVTSSWTLSGAVVTFTAAIPANVNVVSAQWFTASTTAGVGSLTDPASNVLSGAGLVAAPYSITSNTLYSKACFVESRATAITIDLTKCTVVRTGGYASAGDGGGATFKSVSSSAQFQDTYITAATLVGGNSGTNGTYLGVSFGGGVGQGCEGSGTVSGNAVSALSIVVPCPGYKVGDVLTASGSIIGNVVGFSYTVTAVSTAQASFIDGAGNHWQFVTDNGQANVLQFGCKGDWNGTDGAATNNSPCIWSAAAWASFPVGASSAGVNGNRVYVPRGSYMTCGQVNFSTGSVPYYLQFPQGVWFDGPSVGGATFKECAADSSANHYVELCDSNSLAGQFGCKLSNITIDALQVAGSTSGIAMVYSNSGQQFPLLDSVNINANLRSCVKYEIGKGGAANANFYANNCVQASGATNPGYIFNSSSTQVTLRDSVIAGAGSSGTAIQMLAGRMIVDGLDVESYGTGLLMNNSTSGNNSVYRNVQQQSNNCTQAITLQNTNTPGNILLENVATTCPTTILNGQSTGTNFTGNILKQITCVSGACS